MCARINFSGTFVSVLALTIIGGLLGDSIVYSGFLGCRFSRVCRGNELCVNDLLFGNCQRDDQPPDVYQYLLTPRQLTTLQTEISRLLLNGYSWQSLYTQCVLANVLLAFRTRSTFNADFCSLAARGRLSEYLGDDAGNLLADFYDRDRNAYLNGFPEEQGRFPEEQGRSAEERRRFPEEQGRFPEEQGRFPEEQGRFLEEQGGFPERQGGIPKEQAVFPQDRGAYSDERRGFSEEWGVFPEERLDFPEEYYPSAEKKDELVKIHKYEKNRKRKKWREEGVDLADDSLSDDDLLSYIFQLLESEQADDDTEYTDPADVPLDVPDGGREDEDDANLADAEYVTQWDESSLSPEDAKLLGHLLQGELDVSALDDGQVTRLLSYINDMLQSLDDESPEDNDTDLPSEGREVEQTEELPSIEKPVDKRLPQGQMSPILPPTTQPRIDILDANYGTLLVKPTEWVSSQDAEWFLIVLARLLNIDPMVFSEVSSEPGKVNFHVDDMMVNASVITSLALKHSAELKNLTGYEVTGRKIGEPGQQDDVPVGAVEGRDEAPKYFVLTFVLCGVIAGVVLAVIAIYVVKRHGQSKEKLAQLATAAGDAPQVSSDYQDLCRQRMQSKASEKPEPIHVVSRVGSASTTEGAVNSPSSRSSTSSWSEEPVISNMDISTGHMVLSYMEDHLKKRDRLEEEWQGLSSYEAEPNEASVALQPTNTRKNRYGDILPYDHSRVVLDSSTNVSGSDYINANTIMDHDPRNPAYVATQGPLPHTVADFWQMVWEQGSVIIVNLTRLTEDGVVMCHRYWPEEGSDLYHIYEVHLVSEHIWCEDYLVRSFYLKNLQTNETRTVTQFHFMNWADLGIPSSAKALLEFRRKVNKSYRGRSCPVIVHCSDGVGRTGTYTLIDMVLNRMSKGAKEIDIAASLEHIRDQRMHMVKAKEQFEFALASVAEEVHAILKALPQ